MVCRLELVSTPADLTQDGQSYPLLGKYTHTLAQCQGTFGAFVHAALEGRFRVYRCLDSTGLSSFRVGHEGLAWIRNRRIVDRTRSLAHHSPDQMDLLGLSA